MACVAMAPALVGGAWLPVAGPRLLRSRSGRVRPRWSCALRPGHAQAQPAASTDWDDGWRRAAARRMRPGRSPGRCAFTGSVGGLLPARRRPATCADRFDVAVAALPLIVGHGSGGVAGPAVRTRRPGSCWPGHATRASSCPAFGLAPGGLAVCLAGGRRSGRARCSACWPAPGLLSPAGVVMAAAAVAARRGLLPGFPAGRTSAATAGCAGPCWLRLAAHVVAGSPCSARSAATWPCSAATALLSSCI